MLQIHVERFRQIQSAVSFCPCWQAISPWGRQTACRHGCCCSPETLVWKDAPHHGWAELHTENFSHEGLVYLFKASCKSHVLRMTAVTDGVRWWFVPLFMTHIQFMLNSHLAFWFLLCSSQRQGVVGVCVGGWVDFILFLLYVSKKIKWGKEIETTVQLYLFFLLLNWRLVKEYCVL